ncbi:hypothetical protein HPAG1_0353 [Helicobacter pylori HPAG1]|nr:hypothetical protein HPAG1_0353 [Helicobacter pylori HPAG1]
MCERKLLFFKSNLILSFWHNQHYI